MDLMRQACRDVSEAILIRKEALLLKAIVKFCPDFNILKLTNDIRERCMLHIDADTKRETFYFDNTPIITFMPMQATIVGGHIVWKQPYTILVKGGKRDEG